MDFNNPYSLDSIFVFIKKLIDTSQSIELNIIEARTNYHCKKYKNAHRLFETLQTLQKLESSLYFEFAFSLYQVDRNEDALLYYNKYLDEYDSDPAYCNRAIIKKELNDYTEALEDINIAINLDSNDMHYLGIKYTWLIELKKIESAIECLQLIIENAIGSFVQGAYIPNSLLKIKDAFQLRLV